MRSNHVVVSIDLDRVRSSAERIRASTGVALIAVVKADAYGFGAARVADVLAPVADAFAYFSLDEALEIRRPGIVLGPPSGDPSCYRELGILPAIGDRQAAARYGRIPCALSLDTGMQRFGCDPGLADELLRRCHVTQAFTHAAGPHAAQCLKNVCGGRAAMLHAAATSLLGDPASWLDAVRPGLALYRGAARVWTALASVRDTRGPAGYTRFECPRVGIILAGYSHGLRPGPVMINGRQQRLLEIGMNSSFVSANPADREGDEVVLLGDGLTEATLAAHFGVREHEILCRYTCMGRREYRGAAATGNLRVA